MGYVYFIKPIGMDGPYKIGHSNSPATRLQTLAAWSPFPLELVGTVEGPIGDETFLHQCFSNLHTHHEWFLSSPLLRETIRVILDAGTIEAVRGTLTPKDSIKNRSRLPRSAERKLCTSYKMRIFWAQKRRRSKVVEADGPYYEPDDVTQIIERWSPSYSSGLDPIQPTKKEIARLEEYLGDPDTHSVVPPWKRNVVSISKKAAS